MTFTNVYKNRHSNIHILQMVPLYLVIEIVKSFKIENRTMFETGTTPIFMQNVSSLREQFLI